MSSPQFQGTMLRPDLRALFDEFSAEAARRGLIAPVVMPIVPVGLQAANYSVNPIEEFSRIENLARNSDGTYNRATYKHGQDSYSTVEYGLEVPVDERQGRIFSTGFGIDSETVATAKAMTTTLLGYEKRVADIVQALSANPVTTEWSNASADILGDVKSNALTIRDNTGLAVADMSLVVNERVFLNMKDNTAILDRIKYAGIDDVKRMGMTPQMLAAVLGIKQVVVGSGMYNSADEGQTASMTSIWSNEYAFLGKLLPSGASWEADPGFGCTFAWDADGASAQGTIEMYFSNERRSNVIRCRHDVDEKVLYTAAGRLLSNITA